MSRLQNQEERKRLETCILECEWLMNKTPDIEAQDKYNNEIEMYAFMYHRLAGDWYRRPANTAYTLQKTIVGGKE